mmetsp:Transcript_21371/g.43952  ORF Transcript_21371/g.43952 Transcript_21371/m.43952 type:complete len:237 (-) Transcript_21371:363-1073(-)
MDARIVAATAVRTILTAAKGKASFSLEMLAAPKLCPAAPIPSPRDTGSVTPTALRTLAPIIAANIPVKTTRDAEMETSPPSSLEITMARAVVTLRGMVDRRRKHPSDPPRLMARTIAAVPKRPPAEPMATPVATVGMFDAITPLRLYMAMANEITAGPSRERIKSPAPVFVKSRDPHLYSFKTSINEAPVANPVSLRVRKVRQVLVRIGCMNLVTLAGKREPQTKDVIVAKPIKMV